MRRIRFVFVGLAVLLLVPMALLVQRALESLALEREVSHRAVAERLLDEMERELSSILRAEEERPFDHYRFDAKVGGKGGGALASPASPHVIGHFEIDPAGNFRSTSKESTPRQPAAPRGLSAPPAVGRDELEAIVVRELRAGPDAVPEEAGFEGVDDALVEAPRAWDAAAPEKKRERAETQEQLPGKSKARKQVSPYEALQALNKGALSRSERQVKRAAPQIAARSRMDAPAPAADTESGRGVFAEVAESTALAARSVSPPAPAGAAATTPDAEGDRDRRFDANEIFEEVGPGDGALEVHPMVGRLIDPERLLLYRLVFLDGQRYRQGVVVNLPVLFRRLDAAAVGDGELAPFVGRDFFTRESEPPPSGEGEGFRYFHRFAEPFDALGVRLTLEPLPDVGGAGYLYTIAVLLLLSATAGLLALYRMVAVTVRFAERRSNFVAAVSHELKTPLTAIRMYAEMLRDGMVEDAEKRRSYYATITAESERLTRLINNVLEFSRLEQGSRETSLIVGVIGPVVRDAAAILEPHAREVGFRIDVEVEEGLPPVRFDRDAVLQVVYNLVDNALKYARDAGDRVVEIRCVREGDGVSVAVRDRGPGVATQHLSKIFEAFYRCEDELTRTAKGTGIGLALVRGLAEAMGAAVSGHNLADGGFEVALRFRPAPVS